MKFVEFREQTVKIAEHQEEYITLPAHQVGDEAGTTFVRVELDESELEDIVRNKGFYMSVLTFGKTFGKDANYNFPPMMVYPKNPFPYLQEFTEEMGAIYFKDIDQVTLYNIKGQPMLLISPLEFNKWIPSVGFKTFSFFKVEKAFVKNSWRVRLLISHDKKKGIAKVLNGQFYNKED